MGCKRRRCVFEGGKLWWCVVANRRLSRPDSAIYCGGFRLRKHKLADPQKHYSNFTHWKCSYTISHKAITGVRVLRHRLTNGRYRHSRKVCFRQTVGLCRRLSERHDRPHCLPAYSPTAGPVYCPTCKRRVCRWRRPIRTALPVPASNNCPYPLFRLCLSTRCRTFANSAAAARTAAR